MGVKTEEAAGRVLSRFPHDSQHSSASPIVEGISATKVLDLETKA